MCKADFKLCIQECKGKSCCNCCGNAPNLHRVKDDTSISFRLVYERDCCYKSRQYNPEQCMHLQGKSREQWLKEETEKHERGKCK